ncbi:MAG: alpha/beta hydrolase [Candidatus Marinimicrobia bacterium]|nr:alpha/beta hydrolase [Candidatus Neomarinimicrobiota bacterium]
MISQCWKKRECHYSRPEKSVSLLILHGFMGYNALRYIAKNIYREGISIEAPLLPGHGECAKNLNKVTNDAWIQTAESHFNQLKKESKYVFIMGYSLGTLLALDLARHNHVDGLILLSTALIFPDSSKIHHLIEEESRPLIPLHEIFDKNDSQRLKSYKKFPIVGFREVYKLSQSVKHQLENVKAPLLAFQGAKDTLTPPENLEYLTQHVGSKYIETYLLKNSNHRLAKGPERHEIIKKSINFIHHQITLKKEEHNV